MNVKVKICGITSVEDALAAVDAGADALGFMFYASSPRCVTRDAAAAIIRALPPFVAKVGVFVNPTVEEVRQAIADGGLDTLQFHGEEPPEFHIEVTVDGTRFAVKDPSLVLAGYERRRTHEVPQNWLDQVTVKSWSGYAASSAGQWSSPVVREEPAAVGLDAQKEGPGEDTQAPNGNRKSGDSFTGERPPAPEP